MLLENIVLYSLGIFLGSFGLIVSGSYVAYKTRKSFSKRYINGEKNHH